MPDNKEFGCEKCSPCTVRVAELLGNWVADPDCSDIAGAVVLIERFCPFPQALLVLLKRLLSAAQKNHKLADALLARLVALSDFAEGEHKARRALAFGRVAAVLATSKPAILSTFKEHKSYQAVVDSLERLAHIGLAVSKAACNWDALREERRNPQTGVIMSAAKRISGGGVVTFEGVHAGQAGVVVDFSMSHALVVVREPFSLHQAMKCSFLPRQRELPFSCLLTPIKREHGEDPIVTSDAAWGTCGKAMQVFALSSVDPEYYYLALCADSASHREDVRVKQFINRHDLPMPYHLAQEPR